MLLFFPNSYPDELLYSLCARYHRLSCNLSNKSTVKDLFGTATACAIVDLPSHLGELSKKIICRTLSDPDRLILERTLLPVYAPFLTVKKLKKLISFMKGSSRGNRVHYSSGVMSSTVPVQSYLKYCPECLSEDCEVYGESYWHRNHQFPGVLLCHIHDTWLVEDKSSAISSMNKHVFKLAPEANDADQISQSPKGGAIQHYRAVAQSVAWLLGQNQLLCQGLSVLHQKYSYYLQTLDLANFRGRVSQKSLVEQFISYYGNDFLADVHCSIDQDSPENWLSKLVRKPRGATHPLKHFLLINFLGLNLADFLSTKTRVQPQFGRAPWPCLNPVAEHYKKNVITYCEITRNSDSGQPVGNFYCSCGFHYARKGPDRSRRDRFRRGRIIAFGSVWEKELIRLVVDELKGLRQAARTLEVDTNTVKSHLERLKNEEAVLPTTAKADPQPRRQRWCALVAENQDAGVSELREMAPADYIWLYRNDQEWLLKNSPKAKEKSKSRTGRVNWHLRDAELAAKIPFAAQQLKNFTGRSIRITRTAIGRKLGVVSLLQKKINKLPLTKLAVESVVESAESFRMRRIRHAANELVMRGEPLQPWRIKREAGLGPDDSFAVKREIDRLLFEKYADGLSL